MKKYLLLLSFVLSLSIGANCQEEKKAVYPNYAFVGGEMDYVLFPQDADGNVSFSDTINCNLSKDQIANKLAVLLYDYEHFEKIEIEDVLSLDDLLLTLNIDSNYGMLSCQSLGNHLNSVSIDLDAVEVNVLYSQVTSKCLSEVDF